MFEKWKSRKNENSDERPLTVLAMVASAGDAAQLRDVFDISGWDFRIVNDLEQALAFLRGREASVAILDRDLPDLDWRQAIRRLADEQARVILASFVADDYLWEEVIHCGGYDVIAKPFRRDEVVHMIKFAWAALTKSLPSAPRTK